MKILFATPECAPFVKTGGLGDVSGALPPVLARLGHDVRLLMPAYAGLKLSGDVLATVDVPAQAQWPAAQLLEVDAGTGVRLLLLACPALYERAGSPYVDPHGADHHDNALRFGFLSHVAARLGTARSPLPQWQADVVHANDWPLGLAPLYLAQAREEGPAGSVAASVLTIHNLLFQGLFPMESADALGVPWHWRGIDGVEFYGHLSMLKAGLQFADAITTVSPTYAREIQTREAGVGLDGMLRSRAGRLSGILNGIDTGVWNPLTDALLPHRYDARSLALKALDKSALQARCHLQPRPAAMLFAVVSRLTAQKGIDLVLEALPSIVEGGGQLAVLGQGEPELQSALVAAAARHPGAVAVHVGFDEALAHLIEAGADCFLMPSRFEPCGLNQMYSQAYGTPPLVNAVGGLADSVTDSDAASDGTGFVMRSADSAGFADALQRARAAYAETPRWRRIQAAGMARDFGWDRSAAEYVQVYRKALSSRA
ncbi:glycogen synthase GlgA [Caenimonas terrae]|uniref:Glycogen synthase n=1 Tax=Caenimonas terrae TaxID=696074 RepID=A0ABW0NCJ1_9BURK